MIACQCQFNIVIKEKKFHTIRASGIYEFHKSVDGWMWKKKLFSCTRGMELVDSLLTQSHFPLHTRHEAMNGIEGKYYIFHGLWFCKCILLVVIVSRICVLLCDEYKKSTCKKIGKWFFSLRLQICLLNGLQSNFDFPLFYCALTLNRKEIFAVSFKVIVQPEEKFENTL